MHSSGGELLDGNGIALTRIRGLKKSLYLPDRHLPIPLHSDRRKGQEAIEPLQGLLNRFGDLNHIALGRFTDLTGNADRLPPEIKR
jgi:hypothetical protein